MESTLICVGLPVSLAIIMFSLGLGLTVADFARIATAPKGEVFDQPPPRCGAVLSLGV